MGIAKKGGEVLGKNNITVMREEKALVKRYRDKISPYKECLILNALRDSGLTPHVIDQKEDTLTISYIEGKTCLHLLEAVDSGDMPIETGIEVFLKLAQWLIDFQKAIRAAIGRPVALGDLHLGNFIYSDRIIGVDFEEWEYGEEIDNPARLLAVLRLYRVEHPAVIAEIVQRLELFFCAHGIDPLVLNPVAAQYKQCILRRRSAKDVIRATTGIVLMGGKSSRMQGERKFQLPLDGFTFLDWILNKLLVFDAIALSVDDIKNYGFLQQRLIADVHKEIGPMAGLVSALTEISTPYVFITSCDVPNITKALIIDICAEMSEEFDCVIPVIDGRVHPLFGIYRTNIAQTVKQQIKGGNYKMMLLLDRLRVKYLHLEAYDSRVLFNVNNPAQYALQKHMKHPTI